MESKPQQKWSDVKDTIYGYMISAGLDIENNELHQKLYAYICDEIDEKVQRVWRAEQLLLKINQKK